MTFFILLPIWVILSGRFDLFHLSLGLISCFLVSFFSSDLIFSSYDYSRIPIQVPKFFMYIPWLLFQVFLANIHVMYLVFHPKMMDLIDPKIIKFKSSLKGDLAITTFANSITLTPGTITVYATDFGDFEVHVIDSASAESLPGDMETRIAKIFNK
ncbi:Na+/H+ antiporter subunit E [bacterium]|nr:Na+/H+ antiporter subunit E [bacterium]